MFLKTKNDELAICNQTRRLMLEAYRLTRQFPLEEKFLLCQQIRRAAVCVYINVAEGCSRQSPPERRRLFEVAMAHMREVDLAVGIAGELSYLDALDLDPFGKEIVSSFRQLAALMNLATTGGLLR